jgi:hypothetical protein
VVSEAVDSGRTIGANLLAAYTALTEAGVTGPAETDLVGACSMTWLPPASSLTERAEHGTTRSDRVREPER